MPNGSRLIPIAALALLSMVACNDNSGSAGPKGPPPPGPVLGMIQGTVDATKMTATFTPLAGAPSLTGAVSPAIYGNEGVTATVYGVVDSMIDVSGVSRTWYVRVALRNLEAWPIGSNYNAAAAPDTSGVFLFFSSLPVVTLPTGCACTVNVNNAMGSANFQAPGQKYFWYGSRPSAVQGSPGTDTTQNNPEWQFKTTTFTAPDTAHAFTFVLLVSAAWPRPHENTLTVTYDGTNDSLPDTTAEPRWQPNSLLLPLGTDSWSSAGLVLNAGVGLADSGIYFTRSDSLGPMPAYVQARVKVPTVLLDTIQAVIGLVEPTGGRQMFIGIASNAVSFASFTNSGLMAGSWTVLGAPVAIDGTVFHTYRLRKVGQTSARICVDGVQIVPMRPYGTLQTTQSELDGTSTVFGMRGNALGATSTWTSVTYTIGSDGGGC